MISWAIEMSPLLIMAAILKTLESSIVKNMEENGGTGSIHVQFICRLGGIIHSVNSCSLAESLEKFTCSVYNQKGISSVNEASKTSFKIHENKSESAMQPKKHMLRSNYQPVWKWSLISNPDRPLPVGHGWQMDGDHLIIDWMDLSPAPDEVLKLTHSTC